MDSLVGTGMLGVIATTAVIVLAAWVFGAGLHLALVRGGVPLRGVSLTVALGLATAAVPIVVGNYIIDNGLILLAPVGLASLASVVTSVVAAARGSAADRSALATLVPTASDWACAVVTTVALYPLMRHGLVYWTSFINDFPNYAASADAWLARAGVGPDFLHQHPDTFGAYQLGRSRSEKPSATAIMVFASVATGVSPEALLAPVVAMSALLLTGNLAGAVQRAFGVRATIAVAAVLAPVFSIIPMSRLHDAQVGQVLAVALLAALLHATVILFLARTPPVAYAYAGAVGALGATTVGSNPTLVLGAGISWGALIVWLAYQLQVAWNVVAKCLAVAVGVAALCSLPTIDGFRRSIRSQTDGAPGYDVPVPGPLAAIGLQFERDNPVGLGETMAAWAFVAAVLIVVSIVLSRNRSFLVTLGLGAAVAANGLLIAIRLGAANYATHKWAAVAIALIVPFGLARLVTRAATDRWSSVALGLGAVAAASVALSMHASADTPVRAPTAVFEFADAATLRRLEVVNVDLGDIYRNPIGALAVPSDQVILVGDSYSEPSSPIGDQFVIERSRAEAWQAAEQVPLGGDYVLAEIDLTVAAGVPVDFGAAHPESGRFLYGRWHPADPPGTWTRSGRPQVAFDVPPSLRGRTLTVSLHGARLATADQPRDLVVRVGDQQVASETFHSLEARDVTFTVPSSAVDAHDGRVVLQLETPSALRGTDVGTPDTRVLGYLLMTLTVTAAP